jgi:serine/threonine protein kinase/Tfp pilus assembly protein PilF
LSNKLSDGNDQRTQLLQTASFLEAGTALCQRFTIQQPLGVGAQASVYEAYDELLDCAVAIKVVDLPDLNSDSIAQIRNEVNIARQLNHPHIINVHELFTDGARTFFTMQLIEGTTLQESLQQPLSYEDFQRWTTQLISALQACKDADIKHGDIKPNNIIIDTNNDLRLIDFGLGRQREVGSQNSGHLDYSAPEVINLGLATAQSEVYSLGKVLQEILQAVKFSGATKNTSISKSEANKLNKKLAQLTHSSPNQRPQIDDLESFIFSPSKPNKTYFATMLFGLVLASGLIIYQFSINREDNHQQALDLPSSRVGIVFDNKSVLSANLSTILQTTLIANPSFALVKQEELMQSTLNLGLDPNNIDNDRVKLASIYNLDLVLGITVSELNTQQMILTMSLNSMPENRVIEQFSSTLDLANLNEDLIQLSEDILLRVASSNTQTTEEVNWTVSDVKKLVGGQKSLNSAQIDLRSALSKSVAASLYEEAYTAYLNDDLVGVEQSLEQLFVLKDAPTYWLLQARLLDADVKNKPELALQSAKKLVELFPRRAELLSKRADIYDWLNQPELAIADYNAAISLAPNDGNLFFNVARLKIISGEIREAIEKELTQALVAFRTKGDKTGESLVLNAFGVAHLRLTEYDRALAYFGDSLALRNAQEFPLARANTLSNIANILAIQGNYEGALDALSQAFELAKDQPDLALKAHILDTLGLFHEEQGLFSEALDFYKRGLDINTDIDDSSKAKSMNNVAFMHFLLGDFALAEIYWERASALFTAFNDQGHLIRTQQNLVQLALLKGDTNQISTLMDVISKNLEANQKQELMILLDLRSKWFFSRGLLPDALDQVSAAKEIASNTKDNRAIIELSLWHAEMCMKTLDIECLSSNLGLIKKLGNTESIEQAIVYRWLQFGLLNEQTRPAQQQIDVFIDALHNAKVSEYVKLKILVDMTERFSLSSKAQILNVASVADLSLYYQEYMNFLFLYPHTDANMDKLAQMLVKYPEYWRNHLFLTSFSDSRSQDKQRKSELEWLSNLPEEQLVRYVDRYLNK